MEFCMAAAGILDLGKTSSVVLLLIIIQAAVAAVALTVFVCLALRKYRSKNRQDFFAQSAEERPVYDAEDAEDVASSDGTRTGGRE